MSPQAWQELVEKRRLTSEEHDQAQAAAQIWQKGPRLEAIVTGFLREHGFTGGVNGAKRTTFNQTYPLHRAAKLRDADMVRCLLVSGASLKQKNTNGDTALDVAKKHQQGGSHDDVIQALQAAAAAGPSLMGKAMGMLGMGNQKQAPSESAADKVSHKLREFSWRHPEVVLADVNFNAKLLNPEYYLKSDWSKDVSPFSKEHLRQERMLKELLSHSTTRRLIMEQLPRIRKELGFRFVYVVAVGPTPMREHAEHLGGNQAWFLDENALYAVSARLGQSWIDTRWAGPDQGNYMIFAVMMTEDCKVHPERSYIQTTHYTPGSLHTPERRRALAQIFETVPNSGKGRQTNLMWNGTDGHLKLTFKPQALGKGQPWLPDTREEQVAGLATRKVDNKTIMKFTMTMTIEGWKQKIMQECAMSEDDAHAHIMNIGSLKKVLELCVERNAKLLVDWAQREGLDLGDSPQETAEQLLKSCPDFSRLGVQAELEKDRDPDAAMQRLQLAKDRGAPAAEALKVPFPALAEEAAERP